MTTPTIRTRRRRNRSSQHVAFVAREFFNSVDKAKTMCESVQAEVESSVNPRSEDSTFDLKLVSYNTFRYLYNDCVSEMETFTYDHLR